MDIVTVLVVGVLIGIGLICVIFTWAAVSLKHYEEDDDAGEE